MFSNKSKEIRAFVLGLLFALVLSGVAVAASPVAREIFFGVRVSFNGEIVDFDADAQPFIMDGRTYLPVRAIADLVGLDVDFVDGVVVLSVANDLYVPEPADPATIPHEYEPPDVPVLGTWFGNTFISQNLGLTFTLPATWFTEAAPPSGSYVQTDMIARSPSGAAVIISHTAHVEESPQAFVAALADQLSPDMQVDSGFPDAQTLGGHPWHFMRTVMPLSDYGMNIYAHYFINVQGGTARTIQVVFSDMTEPFEEIWEMFGVV